MVSNYFKMKCLWLILFALPLFGQSSIDNEIDSLKIQMNKNESLIDSLKKDIEALKIQITEAEKNKIRNEYLPKLKNGYNLTMTERGFFLIGADKPSPFNGFLEFNKGEKIMIYPVLEPYGMHHSWRAEYDGNIGWVSYFHIQQDEKKLPFYPLFEDKIISLRQKSREEQAKRDEKRFERFPARFRYDIKNGRVKIGMTREMVIESIGRPQKENKTTYSFRTRMVYNQNNYDYIYLANGIVSNYQKSNPKPTVPQKPVQSEAKEDGGMILLEFLQNALQDINGNSSGRTCQYDGNELQKTYEYKIENFKRAYKWKCLPVGRHTYWIVE